MDEFEIFSVCLNCGFPSDNLTVCDNCGQRIPTGGLFSRLTNEKQPLEELSENPSHFKRRKLRAEVPKMCFLTCRSVRIGSYKAQELEHVKISPSGVFINLRKTEGSEKVTVHIATCDIKKCIAHFGKEMPILILYANSECSNVIRSCLSMTPGDKLFYDAGSENQTHNKVIIVPVKLEADQIGCIKNMLYHEAKWRGHHTGSKILYKVGKQIANQILVRSTLLQSTKWSKSVGNNKSISKAYDELCKGVKQAENCVT